ncbi:hypothetical protein Hanom_Chr05g00421971 [Helianthus anomalus]
MRIPAINMPKILNNKITVKLKPVTSRVVKWKEKNTPESTQICFDKPPKVVSSGPRAFLSFLQLQK